MKKLILVLFALPFILASCENKKQTAQINQLEYDQAQLLKDAASKDSLISNFLETLNQIEANLVEIKTREKIISQETAGGVELKMPVREKINEDIRLINELMAENKKMMSSLNARLKDSKLKIAGLETELKNMIEFTNQQLAERDTEIASLKAELTNLNFSIATLNDTISNIKNRNQQLSSTIVSKTNELNVAYYVVGPRKELIEKNILNKEGGFLGIGRTQKLSGDLNLADFTKIDIRSLKSIPLGVKKATLMSVHPADSYEIVGNEKKAEELVIKDPAVFWQKSKMLVISTEI